MKFEDEFFKKMKPNYNLLENYGFKKENNIYKYSKVFMNENFKAEIEIDLEGKIIGKIIDLDMDDEYIIFRIESQNGEFVNRVREEYEKILTDIAENCFYHNYFIADQSNRIANAIKKLYGDEPYFAWDSTPGAGVFRNPNNEKWYGLIMNIDKSKIDKTCCGEVEIINLKLDEKEISDLLNKKGFYPCYHMNKKYWITIILDDTISDEKIIELIKKSHKYTESPNEWLIPANPKFYDIISRFEEVDELIWKQSSDVKPGDLVFIYVGAPYSALLYKCVALEVNLPYKYEDDNLKIKRAMKIKLLKKYKRDEFTFDKLCKYGVKAIRGPRSIPESLSIDLNK